MDTVNWGSALYQLVAFTIPLLLIGLIIWLIKSSMNRSRQLKEIQENLEEIKKQNQQQK
ncbi:hypothetical protein [Bacillus sp. FJAT-45037]|uniref:hypothetical protein n=1 Tax=Bacillus sp. FJAT-45037 TaxID=2011007 RepID=UPI0012FE2FF1|nr:hypothetical protein [Bacillus sp. FJAT-45037]